jgi:hypothetical protein
LLDSLLQEMIVLLLLVSSLLLKVSTVRVVTSGPQVGPQTPLLNGRLVHTPNGFRSIALEGFSEDLNKDGFVDPIVPLQNNLQQNSVSRSVQLQRILIPPTLSTSWVTPSSPASTSNLTPAITSRLSPINSVNSNSVLQTAAVTPNQNVQAKLPIIYPQTTNQQWTYPQYLSVWRNQGSYVPKTVPQNLATSPELAGILRAIFGVQTNGTVMRNLPTSARPSLVTRQNIGTNTYPIIKTPTVGPLNRITTRKPITVPNIIPTIGLSNTATNTVPANNVPFRSSPERPPIETQPGIRTAVQGPEPFTLANHYYVPAFLPQPEVLRWLDSMYKTNFSVQPTMMDSLPESYYIPQFLTEAQSNPVHNSAVSSTGLYYQPSNPIGSSLPTSTNSIQDFMLNNNKPSSVNIASNHISYPHNTIQSISGEPGTTNQDESPYLPEIIATRNMNTNSLDPTYFTNYRMLRELLAPRVTSSTTFTNQPTAQDNLNDGFYTTNFNSNTRLTY